MAANTNAPGLPATQRTCLQRVRCALHCLFDLAASDAILSHLWTVAIFSTSSAYSHRDRSTCSPSTRSPAQMERVKRRDSFQPCLDTWLEAPDPVSHRARVCHERAFLWSKQYFASHSSDADGRERSAGFPLPRGPRTRSSCRRNVRNQPCRLPLHCVRKHNGPVDAAPCLTAMHCVRQLLATAARCSCLPRLARWRSEVRQTVCLSGLLHPFLRNPQA